MDTADYVEAQRRRIAAFAADEAAAVVDEPGVFGWASTDSDRPAGRFFLQPPLNADLLTSLLETYWPHNAAIIGEDGDSSIAETLRSRFCPVPEPVIGMLLPAPATVRNPPLPAGITAHTVRRVPSDPPDGIPLELAARACMKADPTSTESFTAEQFIAHLRRPTNAVLLAARTNESEVVATAGASLVGSDATIYLVSTDPAHRGRGLATALTARAVNAAAHRGATTVCLDASADGLGIYLRLGFTSAATLHLWNRP